MSGPEAELLFLLLPVTLDSLDSLETLEVLEVLEVDVSASSGLLSTGQTAVILWGCPGWED